MPRDYNKFISSAEYWLSEEEKEKARREWPEKASEIDRLPTSPESKSTPETASSQAQWPTQTEAQPKKPVSNEILGGSAFQSGKDWKDLPQQRAMLPTDVQYGNAPKMTGLSQLDPQAPTPGIPTQYSQMGLRDPYAPKSAMDEQVKQMAMMDAEQLAQEVESQKDTSALTKVANGIFRIPRYQNAFMVQISKNPVEAAKAFGGFLKGGLQDGLIVARYAATALPTIPAPSPKLQADFERVWTEFENAPVEKIMEVMAPIMITKGAISKGSKFVKSKMPKSEAVIEVPVETTESAFGESIKSVEIPAFRNEFANKQPIKNNIASDIAGKSITEAPSIIDNLREIGIEFGKKEIERVGKVGEYSAEQISATVSEVPKSQLGESGITTGTMSPDAYLAFMGVEPATLTALGGSVKQIASNASGLGKATGKFLSAVFSQGKDRVKSPAGKTIVFKLETAGRRAGRYQGEGITKYNESGINKLSESEVVQLDKYLNGEVVETSPNIKNTGQQIRNIYDYYAELAEKNNVQIQLSDGRRIPFKRRANYANRIVKPEIMNKLADEAINLLDEAATLGADEMGLNKIIEQRINSRSGISNEMIEFFEHKKKTGKEIDAYSTLRQIGNRRNNNLFSTFGNWEFARELEFPKHFYETDPRVYVAKYIHSASKRAAEIEIFGQDVGGLLKNIRDIAAKDKTEGKVVTDMIKIFSGSMEVENALSPYAKTITDAVTNFEVTTKIGFGTATIPNTMQLLISALVRTGAKNTVKGLLFEHTKAGKRYVSRSGALNNEAMQSITGTNELSGIMSKTAELSLKANLFNTVNKHNKAVTATAGKYWVEDLYKAANGKSRIFKKHQARRATDLLKEFGIGPSKPLTENALLEASYQLANDLQLMKSVTRDPLWFNNPKTRPLALFWRFKLGQFSRVVKDVVIADLIKYKNPLPLLRLAVGGAFGGEFVRYATDKMKEWISGRKMPDIKENMFQHLLNNYVAMGSMGMISDIFGQKNTNDLPEYLQKAIQSAEFAFSTIPLSEMERLGGAIDKWINTFANEAKYSGSGRVGFEKAMETVPSMVLGNMGAVGRGMAQRVKTPRQKDSQLKAEYSDMRQKILTLYIEGERQKARELREAWNEVHPEKPIRINNDDIIQEKKRRKKQATKYNNE